MDRTPIICLEQLCFDSGFDTINNKLKVEMTHLRRLTVANDCVERAGGIEPPSSVWKTEVLTITQRPRPSGRLFHLRYEVKMNALALIAILQNKSSIGGKRTFAAGTNQMGKSKKAGAHRAATQLFTMCMRGKGQQSARRNRPCKVGKRPQRTECRHLLILQTLHQSPASE